VFFGSASKQLRRAIIVGRLLAALSRPEGSIQFRMEKIEPTHPAFSGFVFKIQANMDPSTGTGLRLSVFVPESSSAI